MSYEDQQLEVNHSANRLEMPVAGGTAFIQYTLSDQILSLIHTEVPPAVEGRGAGSALVEKALQYAKDNGYKIAPRCVFVQSYLKRHPQWNDLVAPHT